MTGAHRKLIAELFVSLDDYAFAEGVDYLKVFVEDGSLWGQTRQTLRQRDDAGQELA